MKAESPGPQVDKLVPKVQSTAKILYGIYFALTMLELVFLLIGRMPLFEALLTVQQAGGGFGADARKALVRLCALQGGQAGVKRAHLPAAVGGKAGAEAVRAELRPGGTAHGADNGICPQAFGAALGVRKLHGVAALALAQGTYRAAGAQLYGVPLQMQLQQRQYVCRLIGIGVHPPGFIGAGI